YRNLQVSRFDAAALQYVNDSLPSTRVEGFESEFVGRPFEWLTLGGTWTYQNTRAKALISAGPPAVFATGPLFVVAKNAVNTYSEVTLPVENIGTFGLGGDITFRSRESFQLPPGKDNVLIARNSDIQGLLNVHATWTSEDQDLEIQFWGKNVTNRRYL